jgi:hypothetical protein
MRIEDQILIGVDDHVVEPPSMSGLYRDHVPAAFKDHVTSTAVADSAGSFIESVTVPKVGGGVGGSYGNHC